MMQAENSKRNRTNSDEEDFAGFDESTLEEPTILLKRMRKYTPVVPDYKKPFLYGWKRELVYRATPGTSKDKGDVYYITPNGRKLRTKADIIAHLKDDLSIENFSFVKEPICGLNDGDEIIRMAKPLGKTNQKQPVTTNSASAKRITKSKRVEKKIKDQEAPVAISSDLHQEQASTGNEIPSDNAKPNQGHEEELGECNKKEIPDVDTVINSNILITKQNSSVIIGKKTEFMANYLRNVSIGFEILLQTFQYLKVQELSRASCVCRMWRTVANHPILWKTVRMKNSHINDWKGFAKILSRSGTRHLDLRKSLISSGNNEEIWKSFSESISSVENLEKIDMCKCPSSAVESLLKTNYNLKVLNALAIRSEEITLNDTGNLSALEELRLKSVKFTMEINLTGLNKFTNLKHLSLTTVSRFVNNSIYCLSSLTLLKTLELGECIDLPLDFSDNVLMKLENLQRLRLEKGQNSFPMFDILNTISMLKKLEQLELINCDVKIGFDEHIAQCTNLQKLLLIPTYVSQSAATNYMIMKGIKNLRESLKVFIWAVTVELLRVTELYIDQCDKDNRFENISNGGESIPILRSDNTDSVKKSEIVEICPLTEVHDILSTSCPKTSIKILKTPVQNTWKLTIADSV